MAYKSINDLLVAAIEQLPLIAAGIVVLGILTAFTIIVVVQVRRFDCGLGLYVVYRRVCDQRYFEQLAVGRFDFVETAVSNRRLYFH
jgi:hypothetical protein